MPAPATIGNRIAPPRFILFGLLLGAGWGGLIPLLGLQRGTMAGFTLAALVFLLSCVPLFRDEAAAMRRAARENDANRFMLLAIGLILSLAVLAAIASQLSGGRALGHLEVALVIATLVTAWLFANAIYALHYAHLYYVRNAGGRDSGGLKFPGRRAEPDYVDFVYFAFTLGVALQTADVVITSPQLRRIVILHCIAAFFFNLGVLALSVNILAGSGS